MSIYDEKYSELLSASNEILVSLYEILTDREKHNKFFVKRDGYIIYKEMRECFKLHLGKDWYDIVENYVSDFTKLCDGYTIKGYDFLGNIMRFYLNEAGILSMPQDKIEELADNLYFYTLIACIRELRHFGQIKRYSNDFIGYKEKYILYCIKYIYECFSSYVFPVILRFIRIAEDFSNGTKRFLDSSSSFWVWGIYPFLEVDSVLNFCEYFIECEWNGGYGGEKWYYISQGLKKRKNTKLFIDRQVHAQHNGSFYLDKIGVDVSILGTFLNIKASSDVIDVNSHHFIKEFVPELKEEKKSKTFTIPKISIPIDTVILKMFKLSLTPNKIFDEINIKNGKKKKNDFVKILSGRNVKKEVKNDTVKKTV